MLNVKEDCSNFDELKTVSIILGNTHFTLEPKDYVIRSDMSEFAEFLAETG